MHGIDIVDPNRHPRALVGGVVPFRTERALELALAATALGVLTQEISHSPEQTPPKPGGVPHSQPFVHPSFSNQAKLCCISETFRIGVSRLASIRFPPY